MKKIVVKGKNAGKDWYANLPITRIEKVEDVIFAYNGNDFVGKFDLGYVDVVYVSDTERNEESQ